ncbi:hypothetical protein OUZ56_004109 [Daphnia magna]|uniref:Transmembrane protein n=1 Tax=Daphnia magna TaxID=35525 RepID=A0ABQ9YNS1_9CRUS|nr:hypothetical protein OUZ56_004109 [Daphnia magna]
MDELEENQCHIFCRLEYLQWLRVLFVTTDDCYSFFIYTFDNCKVSLFFMVLAINIIISASNLTHLQLASYRVIRPTSPHYFKLFNSALSSVRHRFARSSHRFRFAASFSVVFVFSIISSPSLSSSHRRLCHRLIAVFVIVSSPPSPSPSSNRRLHLRHLLIAVFVFVVSPSFATMEQSDPEKKKTGDRA